MKRGKKKGKRECSPVEEDGEEMNARFGPEEPDRMVPPSNAPPSRGEPEGGGVPVQTDSPDNGVSGRGWPNLMARKASPFTRS